MSKQSIETQLEQQIRLQEMLMDIASTYISMQVDSLNESIETTLGAMGRFVQADRVYIFAYDWEAKTCSNTYEWCEQGIRPEMTSLQQIPLDMVNDWVRTHCQGQTMHIPDVLALPADNPVRHILEPQNIKSLIAVPMMQGQQCVGFVGFDSVRQHYHYSTTEQRLLVVFAQMLVNVFERRDTELALRQAKELALASSKAKSAFLANMSHEIRTPLNAVIGFTDLLLTTPLTPTQQQYVKHANGSGQVLLGIVNDILDLSKIEASQLNLVLSEADLLQTARDAQVMVQHLADQKQIQLKLQWAPAMPTRAKFDVLRLTQILVNLLNNAIKFTEQGEVVLHIDFEAIAEGRGRFFWRVIDTGIGITDTQKAHLFKAFTQADNSTTRRYGGTGLGLAITHQLVEKMGGYLDCESQLGQGSIFKFQIELDLIEPSKLQTNDKKLHSIPRSQIASKNNVGGITVLVVEDALTNRMLINSQLKIFLPDINILEAGNGEEAIEIIQSSHVDLILMDVHMPKMDGVTATQFIRNMPPPQGHLPIVALTASAHKEEQERCLACGMNAFLTKPVCPDVLIKVLNRYLSMDKAKTLTEHQ